MARAGASARWWSNTLIPTACELDHGDTVVLVKIWWVKGAGFGETRLQLCAMLVPENAAHIEQSKANRVVI
jgi:hypothetical protein